MESRLSDGKYQVLGSLGSGSFGDIYQVKNILTGQHLAIKMEKQRQDKPSRLLQELRMYRLLQGTPGVCKLHDQGFEQNINYLVIDKLASSLDDLFHMCHKHFSQTTVLKIGHQILCRLEAFHQIGYIHRDLKSDNFMVGYGEHASTIFIIDFGLAKPFINPKSSTHIVRKGGKSMVGTAKFASISSHQGFEQSRRDDLQSLAFLLIYLAKGSLPWQSVKSKVKAQKYEKIGQMKKKISAQELCEGVSKQLYEFLTYVRKLEFVEKPNYNYLRDLFQSKLRNTKDVRFDWQKLPLGSERVDEKE